MNGVAKFLNFLKQGKNKNIIKALREENEKLKEKLNFYANSHFDNKEKWCFLSYILLNYDHNENLDDYFLKIKEGVSKYVSHHDVHLVVYSNEGNNEVYTLKAESNFIAANKKYLEKMRYDEITKDTQAVFGEIFNFSKIYTVNKELGYLVLGNKNIKIFEYVKDFTNVVCQITAKILAEQEHRRYFEADSQNKTEFLVNFSHEIRNPLNGIITYSELLKNKARNLDEKSEKYVKNINISARQLNYLMKHITESAKTQYQQLKINKEIFFTNTEILNILSVLNSKITEKNLTVETILTDVELFSDIAKFNQILYNLISNAIKYSPDNGKITLSSWVENGEFNFEIKDGGCGISTKENDKIFKFLSRGNTKEHKEGSGIGLALTKKIIEVQGGKIGYESESEEGTTFWFNLPLDGGL